MSEVEELRNLVIALSRDLNELKDEMSFHRGIDSGQSGIHSPHPNISISTGEFGGGLLRLDSTGIQIKAPDETVAISWVLDFDPNFDPNNDFPNAVMAGTAASAIVEWSVFANVTTVDGSGFSAQSEAADSRATMTANSDDNTAAFRVRALNTAGGFYAQLVDTPLWLGVFTSDPAVLEDGMIWYRSDTDELRARINGVTVTLATTTYASGLITTHEAASDPHTGYALESALQGLSFQNEVMNFPSLEGANDAQPEWWEEADANATLTEVDPPGESITEIHERALKVVVATANSYAYQRYTYADQPRLKSGRTVSCAVAVWSVSSVNARVRLQSSVGSLGVSSTTTAAAWTILKVEGVVLDGTYVDLRLEVDVGTAYFIPLGFHIGSMALSLEKPRNMRYKYTEGQTIEDLSGEISKAFADVDVTSITSPLAVMVEATIFLSDNDATHAYEFDVRRNGSTNSGSTNNRLRSFGTVEARAHNTFTILLDDAQIFETQLTNAAGGSNVDVCRLTLHGYWEWE